MSLPTLTPEQRSAALLKATAVRRERAAILEDLKHRRRSLAEVLDDTSETVTRIKVRRLLEAIPGIGSVRAGQVMAELAVPDGRRLQGLGPRQRERLLEKFPPAA
ncbi:integration host factor, actinobacterial type [Streptomyces decoyicus]|uniref:integration host factor, actinobacterial type n=1 Tax=Streptomyces decoyicus TaxID=249567 RepID=UPI0036523D95